MHWSFSVQGDCDSDAECQGDLVCHRRNWGDLGPPCCGGIPIDTIDYGEDPGPSSA